MHLDYFYLLKDIPSPLATMAVSMLPIAELRVAIPLAIGKFGMPASSAYFWAVCGNVIPPIIIVLFLERVSKFLSGKYAFWKKFFNWLFERTHRKAKKNIEKYGVVGLFLFVAIPLPVTGGWTGAVAAFIFGINHKKSIPAIFAGIMTAGVIIVLLTVGAKSLAS